MENHTAKHFALQLGSLVCLYLSVGFFLALIFGLINLHFPDAADSYWQIESATASIRIGFAIVVVFFPAYVALTRIVNKSRRTDGQAVYLGLTKWLIYLSLLVGGGVLLGDLVAVIYAFLEGDITVRFILKAVAVLVVTGLAFYYYVQDARGYWLKNEKQSLLYGAITSVIVAAVLATSLFYVETPTEVRDMRLDQEQQNDLQTIQWEIESYLLENDELPTDLETTFANRDIPTAPEGRESYRYEVTEAGFNLCATFSTDTEDTWRDRPLPLAKGEKGIINPYDWYYEAGDWCFERTVVLE